jgi:hypothetical protein
LKNTKRIRASLGDVVFRNYGITNSFVSQRDTKPWFIKKEILVELLKLQKNYNFKKTMVLETTKFIVSKHPTTFENQSVFKNHSFSPIP